MTDGRERLIIALPVLIVDEKLPTLKDTELRILLVVLRQTHVAGRERASAWLTHGELCKRTGRASEAISAAIESLSGCGLLSIRDEAGRRLGTTKERQSATGRRFYSITTEMVGKAKTDSDKPKTIDSNNCKHYSLRFSDAPGADLDGEVTRIEQEKARIRERLRRLSVSG